MESRKRWAEQIVTRSYPWAMCLSVGTMYIMYATLAFERVAEAEQVLGERRAHDLSRVVGDRPRSKQNSRQSRVAEEACEKLRAR